MCPHPQGIHLGRLGGPLQLSLLNDRQLEVSALRTLAADGVSCRAGMTIVRWSLPTPSAGSRLRVLATWCTFGLPVYFTTSPSSVDRPYRDIRFLSAQEGLLFFLGLNVPVGSGLQIPPLAPCIVMFRLL